MAKAYWVATYRSISSPEALAGYAKLAGPAIQAAGGRFLARGTAAKAFESGLIQRVVIVEDVVTTGGSSLEAIARVEEFGLVVAGVVAVIDRLEGGQPPAPQRPG